VEVLVKRSVLGVIDAFLYLCCFSVIVCEARYAVARGHGLQLVRTKVDVEVLIIVGLSQNLISRASASPA
jgi:hypothetical protein